MVLEYESVNSVIFLFQYYLFFVLERESEWDFVVFFTNAWYSISVFSQGAELYSGNSKEFDVTGTLGPQREI